MTSYRKAGVDIDAGNALVDRIKSHVKTTERAGVMGAIGGFGGMFDLAECGYNDPVLVAATDGVGTKLKIAQALGRHDTIGVDLVAMCVNDLIVQGARPLFFLDYVATGALDIADMEQVIAGIAHGCVEAGCALIGGETAEMPSMYRAGEYDLAGFAVGAVERGDILPRGDLSAGDVLIGLPSSGLHSNGYSLVRHILDEENAGYDGILDGVDLATTLLEPTKIYVRELIPLLDMGIIKAMAHITGGGITENLPRILTAGLSARVQLSAWEIPAIFQILSKRGSVAREEMLRTFNCGIGMILVVGESDVSRVMGMIDDGIVMGELCRNNGVQYVD